jgi:hypothetical protein
MTYQPFLIANYATGLDAEVQPWLLPIDAFTELLDGYVYRGVTFKRDGYSGFANGIKSIYTESRMVHNVASVAPGTGAINGTNRTYTWTLTTPVSRGSITITGNNPAQTLEDNGLGTLTGNGTGTINYTTGAVSITFTTAPANASTVLLTYDYYPGNPVMGIMNFYPTDNVRQMIVADTQYVNLYDPTTDRLVDISPDDAYTGSITDFWSWVNYADASSNPRMLFSNRAMGDVIQQWDGSTVTNYAPVFMSGTTLNARQMFNFKTRLVLFQTVEGGTLYPRRIRISGTGQYCDTFDQTDGSGNVVPGAGLIDIPDNTWFFGAAYNRDDVIFFTGSSVWTLRFTGSDVTPFVLDKIDGSRGSLAAFSVISYLNRTMAASPRGLIISDGYQVDRMDNNIPKFAYNNINAGVTDGINNFEKVFCGFLDEDRDVYLIYPSEGVKIPSLLTENESDRILTVNFEEDNFAIYRIPLSCMGNFQLSLTIFWSDLTAAQGYPSWDAMSEQFGNWNAFPYTEGTPVAIGGGHKGEIWRLNDTENEDNPQAIRNITIVGPTSLQITTDWNNYSKGDTIFLASILGMVEANNLQGSIDSVDVNYTTFTLNMGIETTGFSSYTSGGIAAKCVPLSVTSKKLNPFVELDRKIRCGWMYFYVSTANTLLQNPDGSPVPAYLFIDVITNDTGEDTTPTFSYQVDCTLQPGEKGSKVWRKIWINQVSRFLQFKFSNNQAGAAIEVHAMMPGFQPVGRLV